METKVNIRKSVYETNSSSTHCIIVKKPIEDDGELFNLGNNLEIHGGDFGWEYAEIVHPFDKIDYIAQEIYDTTSDTENIEDDYRYRMLIKVIKENSNVKNIDVRINELENGYIDHQSLGIISSTGAFEDYTRLKDIIFGNTVIITDNDNTDSDFDITDEIVDENKPSGILKLYDPKTKQKIMEEYIGKKLKNDVVTVAGYDIDYQLSKDVNLEYISESYIRSLLGSKNYPFFDEDNCKSNIFEIKRLNVDHENGVAKLCKWFIDVYDVFETESEFKTYGKTARFEVNNYIRKNGIEPDSVEIIFEFTTEKL